jgi:hypothetical protein
VPALAAVPALSGDPVRLRFLPDLTTARGKLRSGAPGGTEVHAASYPRRREMVLDAALLRNEPELARILVHEIFHFCWFRLGNALRASYGDLLEWEVKAGARGELGWPSESVKQKLRRADWSSRSLRWREYTCESFCDTAAWLYAGLSQHPEWSLPARFRRRRARWFGELTVQRSLVI